MCQDQLRGMAQACIETLAPLARGTGGVLACVRGRADGTAAAALALALTAPHTADALMDRLSPRQLRAFYAMLLEASREAVLQGPPGRPGHGGP